MPFIIIIWHQAGGRNNDKTYYSWNDPETETAKVFDTREEATIAWRDAGLHEIHAGYIVDIEPSEIDWS